MRQIPEFLPSVLALCVFIFGAARAYSGASSLRSVIQDQAIITQSRANAFFHLYYILDRSVVPTAIVEMDGVFARANEAFGLASGWPAQELQGMTWMSMTHEDDVNTDLDYVEKMKRGEITSYKIKKRYVGKDGLIYPVELRVTILRGSPDRFLSTVEPLLFNDLKLNEV